VGPVSQTYDAQPLEVNHASSIRWRVHIAYVSHFASFKYRDQSFHVFFALFNCFSLPIYNHAGYKYALVILKPTVGQQHISWICCCILYNPLTLFYFSSNIIIAMNDSFLKWNSPCLVICLETSVLFHSAKGLEYWKPLTVFSSYFISFLHCITFWMKLFYELPIFVFWQFWNMRGMCNYRWIVHIWETGKYHARTGDELCVWNTADE
jgi:hypothetical protein